MSTREAWLIGCGGSLALAVSDHEMAEYVQNTQAYAVPGAPGYCSAVMVWQRNIVPIMNLAAIDSDAPAGGIAGGAHVCVLHYQDAPNRPLQHLALCVNGAPQKIRVDDAYACEIPESLGEGALKQVSLACFSHDGLPVLIIDIARLCSADFRELAHAA